MKHATYPYFSFFQQDRDQKSTDHENWSGLQVKWIRLLYINQSKSHFPSFRLYWFYFFNIPEIGFSRFQKFWISKMFVFSEINAPKG